VRVWSTSKRRAFEGSLKGKPHVGNYFNAHDEHFLEGPFYETALASLEQTAREKKGNFESELDIQRGGLSDGFKNNSVHQSTLSSQDEGIRCREGGRFEVTMKGTSARLPLVPAIGGSCMRAEEAQSLHGWGVGCRKGWSTNKETEQEDIRWRFARRQLS